MNLEIKEPMMSSLDISTNQETGNRRRKRKKGKVMWLGGREDAEYNC